MGSIGESLRQARERKGITLQQAEDDTKIRKLYLQALEDGNFDVIPGKVYARGFLRNYALYLGLDQDEIMLEYKLMGTPQRESGSKFDAEKPFPRKRATARSERNRYFATALVALFAITSLFIYDFVFGKGNEMGSGDSRQPSSGQVGDQHGNPGSDTNNSPKVNPTPGNSPSPSPSNTAGGDSAGQPAPDAGTGLETPQDNAVPSMVKITLNGKDEVCWAKVWVEDSVQFVGNINPGESKSFSGKKVKITLGNAGAVEVIKDGQSLGLLGGIGQVVKNREFSSGDTGSNTSSSLGITEPASGLDTVSAAGNWTPAVY